MPHLPNKMRAIEIVNPGGDYTLGLIETDLPVYAATEVLIKVTAFGINRPDIVQCEGRYAPPEGITDIPGLEVSGVIVAMGEATENSLHKVGDHVCALVAGGGYAEYCCAPIEQILPIPEKTSEIAAAAIPETFYTVWSNVFDRAKLQSDEKILIHGGSSGIGTTAIQLAKAFGAEVYTTCGTDDKTAFCDKLGAVRSINYKSEDYVEVIKDVTQNQGVDVVLDMVGGDYLERNLKCLAINGRHVSIAMLRGPKAQVNIFDIMRRRLTLTGSTLRARSTAFKGDISQNLLAHVWPLIENGQIQPIVHEVFEGFDQVIEAHKLMKSSQHIGKLVVRV